jgi:hypothetical protein
VTARDVQMSLADQAVRDSVRFLVAQHTKSRPKPRKRVRSRAKRG